MSYQIVIRKNVGKIDCQYAGMEKKGKDKPKFSGTSKINAACTIEDCRKIQCKCECWKDRTVGDLWPYYYQYTIDPRIEGFPIPNQNVVSIGTTFVGISNKDLQDPDKTRNYNAVIQVSYLVPDTVNLQELPDIENIINLNRKNFTILNKDQVEEQYKNIVINSLLNAYNNSGKSIYNDDNFYNLMIKEDTWSILYDMINKNNNVLPFITKLVKDFEVITNQNCTNSYFDKSKNQSFPAPFCSMYKSQGNNIHDIAKVYMNYIISNQTQGYDTYIKNFCKNNPSLKNYECSCIYRSHNQNYIDGLKDFVKHGTYTMPNGKTTSIPPSCWFPNCTINNNWLDLEAYPNPQDISEGCGEVDYCKQKINIKDNTIVNSIFEIFNKGCPCSKDNDCPQGLFCRNGKCIECITNCPDGKVCNNGFCVECSKNNPCPDGKICNGLNQCVECINSSQCDGADCVNFKCVECSLNKPCPDNKTCVDGKCKDIDCSKNADCANNEICVKNTCVECETDTDCSGNSKCYNNKCVNFQLIFLLLIGLAVILLILAGLLVI